MYMLYYLCQFQISSSKLDIKFYLFKLRIIKPII